MKKILFERYIGKLKKTLMFIETEDYIIYRCLRNDSIRIVADKKNNKKINSCEYCKECEFYYIVENYCKNKNLYNFDDILENKKIKKEKKLLKDKKIDNIRNILNILPKNKNIKIDDDFINEYVDLDFWKNKINFMNFIKKNKEVLNISVESKRRKGTFLLIN